MTSVVTTTPRRPLWHTLTVCLAILASGLLFQQVQRSSAAVTPNLTLTASNGMLEVEWSVDQAEDRPTAHRLKWWTGSSASGNPTESVVLTNISIDTTESIVLPLTNGTYTVQVEQTLDSNPATAVWTVVDSAKTATVTGYTAPSCTGSDYACGTATVGAGANAFVRLYLGESSAGAGGSVVGSTYSFGWAPTISSFPSANFGFDQTGNNWIRLRAMVGSQNGGFVNKWWSVSAFGDDGGDFDQATEVLLPKSGTNRFTFALGTLTGTGSEIGGRITKDSGTGAPNLQATDFVDLCVHVFRLRDEQWRFATILCSFGSAQFGFANRGDWKQKLLPGNYRIRIWDRPNYFGANLLLYNVKFAGQWWTSSSTRAENISNAETITVAAGDPARTNIDAVLRAAKQLRVDVTNVPTEFQVAGGQGQISVADSFGNWTGGAMEYSAADNKWTAAVTGLVEGRAYKVFLAFNGQNGASRWWLIGGGNLELADGVVPSGDVLVEPWQPKPYQVRIYDETATSYSEGDACIALLDADGVAKASACQEGEAALLQRVEPGTYTVNVWQKDTTTGEIIGNPLEFGPITISTSQTASNSNDYACGISNLEADQAAQFGSTAPCVVVLPRTVIESTTTTTTPSNS